MLDINNIGVFLPDGYLFKDVSFQLVPGDRTGLTGKNGAGKSTLLKLISGNQTASEGKINIAKGTKIGYLTQDIRLENTDLSVYDFVFQQNKELLEVNTKLEHFNNELATRQDYESESYNQLLIDFNDVNERYNILGGHQFPEQVARVLIGLGFDKSSFDKKLNEFSGGWQMRAVLAGILVNNPDILLLDEPTNHLDIISIAWLEKYLKQFSGVVLLISHDRRFLDNVTNRTLEINKGQLYDYRMNYSKYLVQREEELTQQLLNKKQQDKDIKRTEELINKYRAKANKAAFAQSLIKKLDKMDKIEVDERENMSFNISFPLSQNSGKRVLELENINKSYGSKHVLSNLEQAIDRGEKIALIGANGTGKSTLVKIISKEENYDGNVNYGHNVDLGYFSQDEADRMDQSATVFETIDRVAKGEIRTKIRAILGGFLFSGEAIDKKVKVLSGGEKNRLGLCRMIVSPSNFLILDEPTNHLDIPSKEVLKDAIKQYPGTVIVVSHDREFLDGLVDKIWEIKDGEIKEHYVSVDEFLKQREMQMQETLLEEKKEKAEKKSGKDSYEKQKELKKLQNRVKKLEREIEQLEEKKKASEATLANLDYADEAKANVASRLHKEISDELDLKTAQWEEAAERLME